MNCKSLLCLGVFLGFQALAWCNTNITLVATDGTNTSLTVSSGQIAKVTYAVFTARGAGGPSFYPGDLTISVGGVLVTHLATNQTLTSLPVVVGPATISLRGSYVYGGGTTYNGSGLCTINLCSPSGSFVPSTAVVIPADSGGPVNIILESSTDLVSWTAALPGTYGTTTTNRFFRVRAQRTP
jgi:hypothetical protein